MLAPTRAPTWRQFSVLPVRTASGKANSASELTVATVDNNKMVVALFVLNLAGGTFFHVDLEGDPWSVPSLNLIQIWNLRPAETTYLVYAASC